MKQNKTILSKRVNMLLGNAVTSKQNFTKAELQSMLDQLNKGMKPIELSVIGMPIVNSLF